MKIGVIVGRFQVPQLHDGHKWLFEQVANHSDKIFVFIGCSEVKGDIRQPFTHRERLLMITKNLPQDITDKVIAWPQLFDHASNEQWSLNLDDSLLQTFKFLDMTVSDITLYGSRDSFIPYYKGQFKTEELPCPIKASGTDQRKNAILDYTFNSDQALGMIKAYARLYPRVYPTVDIAVFHRETGNLLLGRKPGMTYWQLPGGFVDQEDETLEDAAIREVAEEAGVHSFRPRYVCSKKIKDWRYNTKETGFIQTSLFRAYSVDYALDASDDLEEVRWFSLDKLPEIGDNHKELVKLALEAEFYDS